MTTVRIVGLDEARLDTFWNTLTDHGGNAVEPFVDHDGDWPLRCCLRDSRPGEEVAIVAWSPFPWRGAYAETGPIVVHSRPCGATRHYRDDRVPLEFRNRPQVLRPYGHDKRIAYEHHRLIEAGDDLDVRIAELLAVDDITFVHARNPLSGCYSFTAERRVHS